jgi:DNA (cytosine-5)-methyltransferase 1
MNFRYTLEDLKKSSDRKLFTYVTTFAGGGGSSCGYKLAGGDCLLMNEFQRVAVDTYLKNWPGTTNICDDIKNVTGQQIMDMTGLKPGELDILDSSPPCPPFSMAGSKKEGWNKEKMAYGMKQKNIEDLTWEAIRLAGELKPKVIVCENVKGLTMEYAARHFSRMLADIEALGYKSVWKILKGHEHGVPQKRERVFIVAVRNDIALSNMEEIFPEPDSNEPTIRDAIEDLQSDPENQKEAKELVEIMRKSSKGKWVYGFETNEEFPGSGPCKGLVAVENPNKVVSIGDDIVRPWFTEQIKRGIITEYIDKRSKKKVTSLPGFSVPLKPKHSYYMSRIVPYDQAAHSLTEQGLQPRFMGGNHIHPTEWRVYTPTEAKRLMTLPDDYKFTGTLDEKQARMGLMVAPICMYYLIKNIYEKILVNTVAT